MAPQASKKCGLLSPDHLQIGCYARNRRNGEQLPGTFAVLTISSLFPLGIAQDEISADTPGN